MGLLRATLRFLLFILWTTYIVIAILCFSLFAKDKRAVGVGQRRLWAKGLTYLLGIKVIKKGKADYKNVLFLSNHRSYIDPVGKVIDIEALILAKAEVRSWPIIGYGASLAGVYFVKREKKESRIKARQEIAKTIKNGHSILVYPEGTTTDLPHTLSFKPKTFQIAAEHKVEIVPIAIEYQDVKDAWIGDDTFVRHFFQTFAKKEVVCAIHYGSPMWDGDGDVLREKVQHWVNAEILEMRKQWDLPIN